MYYNHTSVCVSLCVSVCLLATDLLDNCHPYLLWQITPPWVGQFGRTSSRSLIFLTELLCGQTASRSNPPQCWLVWQNCCVAELPTTLISVKCMAIYFKFPVVSYPFKLYHFCTLQIKLSTFGRSNPSPPLRVSQFGRTAYKAYFCEIYGHLLKNSLLFLYRFKFSEAYILLYID